MSSDVKARMVEGAALLLARQGVQATSFGEVLKATGAPRGSLYHHFPRGKDQLIEDAIDLLGERAFEPLSEHVGDSAEKITQRFIELWRSYLERSHLQAGCAILAVTVTTDSVQLAARAAAVFQNWRDKLAALLQAGGLSRQNAQGFAATLIAGVEGATVFSRAEQSMAPFDLVTAQMLKYLKLIAIDTQADAE